MLVLNQKHLNVITRDNVEYDNESRPQQRLGQRNPVMPGIVGEVKVL